VDTSVSVMTVDCRAAREGSQAAVDGNGCWIGSGTHGDFLMIESSSLSGSTRTQTRRTPRSSFTARPRTREYKAYE
jgi:hypothetical protein